MADTQTWLVSRFRTRRFWRRRWVAWGRTTGEVLGLFRTRRCAVRAVREAAHG